MVFKRAVQRYGRTPEPDTPYARAAQVWDERIGSARAQAHNWRLMAFGALGLAAAFSGALVWQSSQSRIVPYVVEVDRLGEARAVARVDAGYKATDAQVAWHLARFISQLRSRSLDPVLMRDNWLAAYDFVTARGARFLGDYARADDPFAEVGAKTVSVQVTSVVRASDRSFQVKWTESRFDRGSLEGRSRWTAILTVEMKPPRTAAILRKNPLGLYVDAIDWSEELEPAAPAPAQHPSPAAAGRQGGPSIPAGSPLDPAPDAAPNAMLSNEDQP
jgi:type IV secretion system protein VirB5